MLISSGNHLKVYLLIYYQIYLLCYLRLLPVFRDPYHPDVKEFNLKEKLQLVFLMSDYEFNPDHENLLLKVRDKNGDFIKKYRSFIKGIFDSFADAPGGFSEELKEITWAFGLEYVFQKAFALRTGYFNESIEKGSRRFLTLGAGFDIDFANIDISYLFSTSKIRNPLENTLRFSITLPLSNQNIEIDENNEETNND